MLIGKGITGDADRAIGMPQALFFQLMLTFVEQPTVPEILPGGIKEPDIHEARP